MRSHVAGGGRHGFAGAATAVLKRKWSSQVTLGDRGWGEPFATPDIEFHMFHKCMEDIPKSYLKAQS
jgi:hypothetical protein